jgi:hypothetical protein
MSTPKIIKATLVINTATNGMDETNYFSLDFLKKAGIKNPIKDYEEFADIYEAFFSSDNSRIWTSDIELELIDASDIEEGTELDSSTFDD